MQLLTKLKDLVRTLKREIVPIYYAMLDKRTPIIAKVLAGVTIGYMLSPIDLIPDFVPILGLLDDLILVPILIKLTLHFIPKELINEIKNKIDIGHKLPKKWYFAIPVILIYVMLVYLVSRFSFK
jgi:uncharacterized membrane protein YkvA (DUF1232 family)